MPYLYDNKCFVPVLFGSVSVMHGFGCAIARWNRLALQMLMSLTFFWFERAARPQCAKMCSALYISHFTPILLVQSQQVVRDHLWGHKYLVRIFFGILDLVHMLHYTSYVDGHTQRPEIYILIYQISKVKWYVLIISW